MMSQSDLKSHLMLRRSKPSNVNNGDILNARRNGRGKNYLVCADAPLENQQALTQAPRPK